MSFISLVSSPDDPTLFQNNFTEGVFINKTSTLQLNSLVCGVNNNEITVFSSGVERNNIFYYQIVPNVPTGNNKGVYQIHKITIPSGNYLGVTQLALAIQKAIRNKSVLNSQDSNDWDVTIASDKLKFEFKPSEEIGKLLTVTTDVNQFENIITEVEGTYSSTQFRTGYNGQFNIWYNTFTLPSPLAQGNITYNRYTSLAGLAVTGNWLNPLFPIDNINQPLFAGVSPYTWQISHEGIRNNGGVWAGISTCKFQQGPLDGTSLTERAENIFWQPIIVGLVRQQELTSSSLVNTQAEGNVNNLRGWDAGTRGQGLDFAVEIYNAWQPSDAEPNWANSPSGGGTVIAPFVSTVRCRITMIDRTKPLNEFGYKNTILIEEDDIDNIFDGLNLQSSVGNDLMIQILLNDTNKISIVATHSPRDPTNEVDWDWAGGVSSTFVFTDEEQELINNNFLEINYPYQGLIGGNTIFNSMNVNSFGLTPPLRWYYTDSHRTPPPLGVPLLFWQQYTSNWYSWGRFDTDWKNSLDYYKSLTYYEPPTFTGVTISKRSYNRIHTKVETFDTLVPNEFFSNKHTLEYYYPDISGTSTPTWENAEIEAYLVRNHKIIDKIMVKVNSEVLGVDAQYTYLESLWAITEDPFYELVFTKEDRLFFFLPHVNDHIPTTKLLTFPPPIVPALDDIGVMLYCSNNINKQRLIEFMTLNGLPDVNKLVSPPWLFNNIDVQPTSDTLLGFTESQPTLITGFDGYIYKPDLISLPFNVILANATAESITFSIPSLVVELLNFSGLQGWLGGNSDIASPIDIISQQQFIQNTDESTTGIKTLTYISNMANPVQLNLPTTQTIYSLNVRIRDITGKSLDKILKGKSEVVLYLSNSEEWKNNFRKIENYITDSKSIMANKQENDISDINDPELIKSEWR